MLAPLVSATHALLYVRPSHPQTGIQTMGQA
jgi:hypothetical protein